MVHRHPEVPLAVGLSSAAGPCAGFPWAGVSSHLPVSPPHQQRGAAAGSALGLQAERTWCHQPSAPYSPPQNIINAAEARSLI